LSSLLSPNFIIGHIRIGSVEGASCVNMGNNWPTGFESHKKHNQGFGSVGGDNNHIDGLRSLLNDSDFLDMFNPSDDNIPDWLKEKIVGSMSHAETELDDNDETEDDSDSD
jgi:hypothetical protein